MVIKWHDGVCSGKSKNQKEKKIEQIEKDVTVKKWRDKKVTNKVLKIPPRPAPDIWKPALVQETQLFRYLTSDVQINQRKGGRSKQYSNIWRDILELKVLSMIWWGCNIGVKRWCCLIDRMHYGPIDWWLIYIIVDWLIDWSITFFNKPLCTAYYTDTLQIPWLRHKTSYKKSTNQSLNLAWY